MRVTLIAAQSLDGFITHHDTAGSAFASEADRAFFKSALKGFDTCVMGAETYRTAREAIRTGLMPDRLRIVVTHTPSAFETDVIPEHLEFINAGAAEIVAELKRRGRTACALLGGSQIHSLFLEAGCVDELWITVEPVLFGSGTGLVAGRTDVHLELLEVQNLSAHTLLLKYKVSR